MNNFENQLDEIRIKLYEDTKMLCKDDIIKTVNSNAQKIAHEFGIDIADTGGGGNRMWVKGAAG